MFATSRRETVWKYLAYWKPGITFFYRKNYFCTPSRFVLGFSMQLCYDGFVVNGCTGIYRAFGLVAEKVPQNASCLRGNAQQLTASDGNVCLWGWGALNIFIISLYFLFLFGLIMISVRRQNRREVLSLLNCLDSKYGLGARITEPQTSNPSKRGTHTGWLAAVKCTVSARIITPLLLSDNIRSRVTNFRSVPRNSITDTCLHVCYLHMSRGRTQKSLIHLCRKTA